MTKARRTRKKLDPLQISLLVIAMLVGGFLLDHPTTLDLLVGLIIQTLTNVAIVLFFLIVICGGSFFAFWLFRKRANDKRLRALQLADIDSMNGLDFENYVAKLLEHKGFQVRVTKASGDLGVDVIAEKSPTKYSVQVKRQSDPVSRRAVSDAVAGKMHYDCNAAMVVTNGYFTPGAKELAHSTKCELIDRQSLAQWIVDFQNANELDARQVKSN